MKFLNYRWPILIGLLVSIGLLIIIIFHVTSDSNPYSSDSKKYNPVEATEQQDSMDPPEQNEQMPLVDDENRPIINSCTNTVVSEKAVSNGSINQMPGVNPPDFIVWHDTLKKQYQLQIKNNDPLTVIIKEITLGDISISHYFNEQLPLSIPSGNEVILSTSDNQLPTIHDCSLLYETKLMPEKPALAQVITSGFYVIGHAYGSPSEGDNGVHEPVVNYLKNIKDNSKIQFGIFAGDQVYLNTDAAYTDFITTLGVTEKPYYVLPGNHDEAARDGYAEDEIFLKYWKKKYDYAVFSDNLFLFLDCDAKGWNISEEQIEMIRKAMKENPNAKNILVFTHQLMWWDASDTRFGVFTPNSFAGKEGFGQSNFSTKVLTLFDDFDKPVYFIAGDTGAFNSGNEIFYEKDENYTYIASGVGGNVRDSSLEFYIFEDGKIKINLIALNGDNPNALGIIEDYTRTGSQ